MEEKTRTPRRRPDWWNRTVIGFSLGSLFSDMGHEWVTSLTPGFLALLGAPPIALGLIEGISGAGLSFASLWGGRRADKTSNRFPYVAVGYAATVLKALYGFVGFWPWLILIRTVGWLGRGMRGPMRDTLIADNVPVEAYGRALGVRESMDTLGAVVGPLLGAFFLARVGYRHLFFWSVIPAILSFLAILVFIRDHRRKEPLRKKLSLAATARVAAYPVPFQRLLLADGVFSMGNVAPSFFILAAVSGLRAMHSAIGASVIAIILYAWYNVVYSVFALIAGAATDKSGPRSVLVVGYAACFVCLLGFAVLPPSIAVDAVLFTIAGIATGAQESAQKTYVRLVLPSEQQGRGFGLHASVMGWGTLASGILVGGLWTIGQLSWGFGAAAVAVLASLLLMLFAVPTVRAEL
ncbi:MAG: MFS transporter [Bacilli bacterium]